MTYIYKSVQINMMNKERETNMMQQSTIQFRTDKYTNKNK